MSMERIKIEDITRFKFLSNLTFNSFGNLACFVVHEADLEENTYRSNLWIYDTEKNKAFQLTAGDNEKDFIWLEDGEHILFSGTRDKKDRDKLDEGEEFTVFYKISVAGGEAREVFRIPFKVNSIKEIGANTFLFASTYNPNRPLTQLSPDDRAAALEQKKEEKDYEVLEEIPFWSNGQGFISRDRQRLYLYHSDAGTYEALTPPDLNVDTYSLNEAKNKIVFTASSYNGKMSLENAVYLCDIATRSIAKLTPQEKFVYNYVGFLDDATIVCDGTDMRLYGINENTKFYTIDINTGAKKCLTPQFSASTWNSVGSDCRYGGGESKQIDAGHLYFIATQNDSSYINRVNKSGEIEQLTIKGGSVDSFAVKNGQILFIGLRNMKLQELYRLDGGSEVQITHFNDWVQKERSIGTLEPLSIESEPGITIDGWVIKPIDFDPANKYPAILDIHGGPKTVYGEVFYHEMQYWANEGYFVFFCNPRGSDGKGDEFADIRGKYGTIDYEDLMRFTDAVLDKYPNIDRARIGVTGGSYGGFMTNWIIGHTDRFAAAASQRSISNWISKFATTDIGYYFVEDQNGATPWSDPEKLWFHSPLKYADKVKTPTLFIHSDEDYRCWLAEGLQMFTALKYHGVEARFCLFHGENHELSRSGKPKHRIRRLKEISDWFNRYLKPTEQK